jgi:hypothetical protein
MNIQRVFKRFAAILLLLIAGTGMASAQATRTWVSGVGDDANPCSRTAPCKTFAGAISKTAAGGVISVLDPGGFGAVTITKSITIESGGVVAGILASGTNGVIVNAAATDTVILRGLNIQGANTGLNGIRFLAGKSLVVEDCNIEAFTQDGIDFEPSTTATALVRNTLIVNTGSAGGTTAGFYAKPTGSGKVKATLEKSQILSGNHGVYGEGGSNILSNEVVSSKNAGNGFTIMSLGVLSIQNSVSSENGAAGVFSSGGFASARIANTTITGNANGLQISGSTITSYGTNRIYSNTVDGTPTSTISQQ